MELVIYKHLSLRDSCRLAIKHRLFVNKWSMRQYYQNILDAPDHVLAVSVARMVLVFDNNIPIAAGFCYKDKKQSIRFSFFVRKSYRRKGIGTQIYSLLKSDVPNSLRKSVVIGVEGSKAFFKNLPDKVTIYDYS